MSNPQGRETESKTLALSQEACQSGPRLEVFTTLTEIIANALRGKNTLFRLLGFHRLKSMYVSPDKRNCLLALMTNAI